ncbi:hypothetical protein [Hydrogenophaga sp. NH-16]|uniref:hypothetical protein n=1 Tax=Hydrogenophaga sp. NH-16 TaxID=2184519 RepID=UPI000FDA35A2|nr:hypothetical protein [Hydrogenophaga sp. NH-16]
MAALTSTVVQAGNFASCILEKMPGSSNAATNAAVFQSCSAENPSLYRGVKMGSGRGLFGYKDGNACIIKLAASTQFQPAAASIAAACRCLYNKPPFDGATCADAFGQQ